MSGVISTLDFDGEPLKLVEDAWTFSQTQQSVRNNQYKSDHQLWNCYLDEVDRDPDRANIFIPKIYSIIETKVPREVKSLFGTRPYIPLEAKRKEYREASDIQTQILDEYLHKARFFPKNAFAVKLKNLYGTSFVETLPYYESVQQKIMVPEMLYGIPIGMQIQDTTVYRLRLKVTVFAPWEVYVDPYAVNLEESGGCRYVIKLQLCSKRDLMRLYEAGAYPGMDINALEEVENQDSAKKASHWGLGMLAALGLTSPQSDDDVGVLMRYESEERYIDVWNDMVVVRDIPNPFKYDENGKRNRGHGLINLTRFHHTLDPHTQNQFWGMGEAKPAEILQHMLNDTWNQTFDNHTMLNQMMIYYNKDKINPDSLVRTPGNRVGVKAADGEDIRKYILESPGQPLPRDHYVIPETIERMIDVTSGLHKPNYGEESPGSKTLGEIAILKEAGDVRTELSVELGEQTYMADLALKATHHIDQFATMDDVVEIVGEEKAARLMTLNPNDLPGGFNYAFKGSGRVTNMLIKQRNMKELTPFLMQIPNVLQGWWARKLLEVHELDDLELDEGIIPDEMMMQLQAQAAQQDMQNQMMLSQVKGGQPGQSRQNNPAMEAQASGQEYNRTGTDKNSPAK